MKMRVFKTRISVGALLVAFVLACGLVAPTHAREDISVGQAGDPGDGDEADSASGSSTTPPSQGLRASTPVRETSDRTALLVPMWIGNVVVFRLVLVETLNSLRR